MYLWLKVTTQLVAGRLSSLVRKYDDVNGQCFETIPGKCHAYGDNLIFAVWQHIAVKTELAN